MNEEKNYQRIYEIETRKFVKHAFGLSPKERIKVLDEVYENAYSGHKKMSEDIVEMKKGKAELEKERPGNPLTRVNTRISQGEKELAQRRERLIFLGEEIHRQNVLNVWGAR